MRSSARGAESGKPDVEGGEWPEATQAEPQAPRRLRLGLLVPSSNTTMEPDFYMHLHPDIALHTARMYLADVSVSAEEEMLDVHFPKALHDIASCEPDVVVFGCTSAGALRGNAADNALCRRIEDEAGCPVVSVVASARQALREAVDGGRYGRIGVLTPYIDEVNARIERSLTDDGLSVWRTEGMQILKNRDIGALTPDEVERFAASRMQGAPIDALFLSCTNMRAMEARAKIAQALKIPVITSNQAAFDAALSIISPPGVEQL